MDENEISKIIMGAALGVHEVLGPGLLASTYEAFLRSELMLRGLDVKQRAGLPALYRKALRDAGGRADLLVEDKVIIEIKSTSHPGDSHLARVSTDLRLLRCRMGLLINFNVNQLRDGIESVFNDYGV